MKQTLEEAAHLVVHGTRDVSEARTFTNSDDIKVFILRNKNNLEGKRVRFSRYTPAIGGAGGSRDIEGVVEKVQITKDRSIFSGKIEEYPRLTVRVSSNQVETVYSHDIRNFEVL